MRENISKIVQIIVNIIAVANLLLQSIDKPIIETDYETIYAIVSVVMLIIVICYDTYRNFDVTKEGKLGTKITRALKKGIIENDKVQEILDNTEEN